MKQWYALYDIAQLEFIIDDTGIIWISTTTWVIYILSRITFSVPFDKHPGLHHMCMRFVYKMNAFRVFVLQEIVFPKRRFGKGAFIHTSMAPRQWYSEWSNPDWCGYIE